MVATRTNEKEDNNENEKNNISRSKFDVMAEDILETSSKYRKPHAQLVIREPMQRISKPGNVVISAPIDKDSLREKKQICLFENVELVADCILLLDAIKDRIGKILKINSNSDIDPKDVVLLPPHDFSKEKSPEATTTLLSESTENKYGKIRKIMIKTLIQIKQSYSPTT